MHWFDRISLWVAGHPRIGIAALLLLCTGAGFGVGRWQPDGANLSSSTIETVTANLARRNSGMTKVAMGTADTAPMVSPMSPSMQPQAAPSLSALLPGLEAKVAANPSDAALKFLLAQTYMELEQYAKAAPLLETLHRETPNNPQIALLDVKAHLGGSNAMNMHTALNTLNAINPDDVDAVELWLARGRVLARLDQRIPARDAFLKAQSLLAAGDPRGTEIDMEMAHLANGVKVTQ